MVLPLHRRARPGRGPEFSRRSGALIGLAGPRAAINRLGRSFLRYRLADLLAVGPAMNTLADAVQAQLVRRPAGTAPEAPELPKPRPLIAHFSVPSMMAACRAALSRSLVADVVMQTGNQKRQPRTEVIDLAVLTEALSASWQAAYDPVSEPRRRAGSSSRRYGRQPAVHEHERLGAGPTA